MKKIGLAALAAALLAACTSTPGPMVESGYPTGSLALAAIERGDWATAERLLTDETRLPADDPARLVNLGHVYAATGRTAEAVAVWQRVLTLDGHVEVSTAGGRTARTDQLAREAIAFYGQSIQTAAR